MQSQFKIELKILFASLFLAILLFFLVDLFTFTYKGEGVSGNGNLGLIFVYPAVPVYFFMLVFIYKVSQSCCRDRRNMVVWPAAFLLLICICVYGEYHLAHSLIQNLGGGPESADSVIYRWGWLNQYTNVLFFNFFTFTIGVLLTLLISSCVEIVRKSRSTSNHK